MPKARIKQPFCPIIYVCGYALIQGDSDATFSIPSLGIKLYASKSRKSRKGSVTRCNLTGVNDAEFKYKQIKQNDQRFYIPLDTAEGFKGRLYRHRGNMDLRGA